MELKQKNSLSSHTYYSYFLRSKLVSSPSFPSSHSVSILFVILFFTFHSFLFLNRISTLKLMCNLMVKSKGKLLFSAILVSNSFHHSLSQWNFPWLILTSLLTILTTIISKPPSTILSLLSLPHFGTCINKQTNKIGMKKIVAPKEVVLLDSNGNKMTNNIIGPLEEGSDQVIFCESFGEFTLFPWHFYFLSGLFFLFFLFHP